MSLQYPPFALAEEHIMLRETVRALADDKIAPRAAEVDETCEFPWDVHDALVRADLNAPHIPEQYGGAGADAIATAIVIEEVARACAASSLIPAVNKLGTVPRSEEHTSELQSRPHLVCRLLLEKKKKRAHTRQHHRYNRNGRMH